MLIEMLIKTHQGLSWFLKKFIKYFYLYIYKYVFYTYIYVYTYVSIKLMHIKYRFFHNKKIDSLIIFIVTIEKEKI